MSNLNGSVPGWDNGQSWNREHTWPRALGVDSSGPDNSDLHMLRPADPGVNSDRGSLHFGGAFGQSFGVVNDGGQVWYPGNEEAGMVARQMFYAAVRYDGSDSATQNLELANGTPSSPRLGSLSRMVEWHFEVAPDDFELRRNDVIFDDYQGNRNPFVDRPEYVWSVYVDQNNDSQVSLAGTSVGANGGSTLNLDFGRVLKGGAAPGMQSVTINKTGLDGTYFEVATTGGATSTVAGRQNNFRTGQTDSLNFNVGLNASTATVGLKSGSVIIDNLDVTTGGGSGRGANDVDDAIDLSLEVVDHAIPSFSDTTLTDSLILSFGTVDRGSTVAPLSFDIHNLSFSGFTADLEVDAFGGTGDTAQLTTDLVQLVGNNAIAGGGNAEFQASLDTSCAGQFAASYLVQVSDEDLPGANSAFMTLNLVGTVVGTPLLGDYDSDGDVDNDDYVVWTLDFGSTTSLSADGNGDGVVDAADFTVWQDNFGNSHPTCGSSVVPEPAGFALTLWSMLAICRFRCQDRSLCGE